MKIVIQKFMCLSVKAVSCFKVLQGCFESHVRIFAKDFALGLDHFCEGEDFSGLFRGAPLLQQPR